MWTRDFKNNCYNDADHVRYSVETITMAMESKRENSFKGIFASENNRNV